MSRFPSYSVQIIFSIKKQKTTQKENEKPKTKNENPNWKTDYMTHEYKQEKSTMEEHIFHSQSNGS